MNNNNQEEISYSLNPFSTENNPSSINKSSQEKYDLPSWIKFHLKRFAKGVRFCASVIMEHYLIILVQDESNHPRNRWGKYNSEGDDPASLLAFDLEDHSVQEAEVNVDLFAYQDNYTFTKYGENQILQYYSGENGEYDQSFVCITVESFKCMVKCEELETNERELDVPTAQIYNNCFYIYGKVSRGDNKNELWSFDLKDHTWKLCETSGEGPTPTTHLQSFIFQDSFVVYGGRKDYEATNQADLFLLDFNSMRWTKIEQEEKYLLGFHDYEAKNGGVFYKDHLVILKDKPTSKENNALCCLNLKTKNTWTTFDIKGLDLPPRGNDLMVYNTLLLAFGMEIKDNKYFFVLAVLNLENLGICAPKSAEKEKINCLYLNQTDSDITFQIEDQAIPAHKSVLREKSQFFENLFKSGMAESKQDIIEIKDCEYEIFKEYLRFIYQDTVEFGDGNVIQAIKLYTLADKYLQLDLREKCINFLTAQINIDNVYKMLDFAHQQNIPRITNWCTKLFKDNLNCTNVAELANYLLHRDPDFKDNHKELIEKAITFTIDNFSMIYENEKGNIKLYEDFLIKMIEMDTISSLAKFLSSFDKLSEDKKLCFEKWASQLKEPVFRFVQENIEIIMTSKIAKEFPHSFLVDLTLYQARNPYKQTGDSKKRMEPTRDEENEESPELKKTKKRDSIYGN